MICNLPGVLQTQGSRVSHSTAFLRERARLFWAVMLPFLLICASGPGRSFAQTNNGPPGDFLSQRAAAAQAAAAAAQALFESTNSPNSPAAASSPMLLSAPQSPQAAALAAEPQSIEVQPYGASASFGPHKVAFATDLTADLSTSGPAGAAGAVDMTMVDQQHLRSHIQGLAYISDGQTVIIAQLKSCEGELVSDSQILYSNAFNGISADVLYTYTGSSLEQDIILRKQLPPPSDFGLDASQVRLAVITEFLSPPQPTLRPDPVDVSALNAAAGIEGDSILPDQLIVFPTARIGKGRAFLLGETGESIPVGKSWQDINNRWFLVESTPWLLLKPQQEQLPPYTGSLTPHNQRSFKTLRTAMLNLPRPTRTASAPRLMATAMSNAALRSPGLVLDYLIANTPLLNVQFGPASTNEIGYAAVGETPSDFWTWYLEPGQTSVTLTNLSWSNGSTNGVSLTVSNAPSQGTNPVSDQMYSAYIYEAGANLGLTVSNLPTGIYDIFLYGHGPATNQNGIFQLTTWGTNYGTESTTTVGTNSYTSTNWQEGQQYIVFRSIWVTNTQPVYITVEDDGAGYAIVNGLQMMADNPQTNIFSLINVNFANPNDHKVGMVAIGLTTNDVWTNLVSQGNSGRVTITNIPWSDGYASPVSVSISNSPGLWGNPVADPMYASYVYQWNSAPIPITISNLANGRYDFYLYGHGAANNQDGSYDLSTGGTDYGTKSDTTSGSYSWNSTNWVEGQQYVVFRDVWVTTNAPVVITVELDGAGYAIVNGMQIDLPMPSNDTDSNGDGIPDWWDVAHGLNPHTNTSPIAVSLVTPINNTNYCEPATISIQATAADWNSTITNVDFFCGSNHLAGTTNTPYMWSWPIVPAGLYSLTAVARDLNGLSATSAPVSVIVTNLCGY
jgi:hypothetical protein